MRPKILITRNNLVSGLALFMTLTLEALSVPLHDQEQRNLLIPYNIEGRRLHQSLRLEGDCHRDGQLFRFLDEFLTGPQENPISLPKDASGHLTPIVIWHGLGQTCCEPLSMGRVKNIIANITKAYVVSIKVWLNKLVLDSLRSCVRRNLIIKWVGFS